MIRITREAINTRSLKQDVIDALVDIIKACDPVSADHVDGGAANEKALNQLLTVYLPAEKAALATPHRETKRAAFVEHYEKLRAAVDRFNATTKLGQEREAKSRIRRLKTAEARLARLEAQRAELFEETIAAEEAIGALAESSEHAAPIIEAFRDERMAEFKEKRKARRLEREEKARDEARSKVFVIKHTDHGKRVDLGHSLRSVGKLGALNSDGVYWATQAQGAASYVQVAALTSGTFVTPEGERVNCYSVNGSGEIRWAAGFELNGSGEQDAVAAFGLTRYEAPKEDDAERFEWTDEDSTRSARCAVANVNAAEDTLSHRDEDGKADRNADAHARRPHENQA